jgi:hypothetical protein
MEVSSREMVARERQRVVDMKVSSRVMVERERQRVVDMQREMLGMDTHKLVQRNF